jgi:hypothetical protein
MIRRVGDQTVDHASPLVLLDLAALRFGHDSRSECRELPLAGDPTVGIPT